MDKSLAAKAPEVVGGLLGGVASCAHPKQVRHVSPQILIADSDEAGHPFRREGGHPAGACGEQGSWWIEVAALRPATAL